MLPDSVNRPPIQLGSFGKICEFVIMCLYYLLYSAAAWLAKWILSLLRINLPYIGYDKIYHRILSS